MTYFVTAVTLTLRQMHASTHIQTHTQTYTLSLCLTGTFFQSYSRLGYATLGRSPKVNSWELLSLLWQNFCRLDALPVTYDNCMKQQQQQQLSTVHIRSPARRAVNTRYKRLSGHKHSVTPSGTIPSHAKRRRR